VEMDGFVNTDGEKCIKWWNLEILWEVLQNLKLISTKIIYLISCDSNVTITRNAMLKNSNFYVISDFLPDFTQKSTLKLY
jgi:hypothetical protein